MHKKRNLIFTILSLVILIILLIIVGSYYLLSRMLSGIGEPDSRNTIRGQLSEITWENKPYKIYYRTNDGIYSILTNGKDKKLVYNKSLDYLLLENTKNILLKEKNEILLVNENNVKKEIIFEGPKNKWIQDWRISPDEQSIVLQLTDDHEWDNKDKRIVDDIYIVNLISKQVIRLDRKKDLYGFDFINGLRWNKDSQQILVTTSKSYSSNDVRNQFIIYSMRTNNSILKGEQDEFLDGYHQKPLSAFVDDTQFIKTRRDGVSRWYYYSRYSPDGTKTFERKYEGDILVNGEKLLFWSVQGLKMSGGCVHVAWLGNNHLIMECNGIVVAEVGSKKVAMLTSGYDVQMFGQEYDPEGL